MAKKQDIVVLVSDKIDGLLFARLRAVGLAYGVVCKARNNGSKGTTPLFWLRKRDKGSDRLQKAMWAINDVYQGMLGLSKI